MALTRKEKEERGKKKRAEKEKKQLEKDVERLNYIMEKRELYPPIAQSENRELSKIMDRARRRDDLKRQEEKRNREKAEQKQEEAEKKGYLTKNGIIVRSKAERVIADYLTSKNLEWEYEKRFYYMGDEYVLSDFYLPEHDCYIEYFGMVNHHNVAKRKEYESKTQWKIELYERWGKKLIYLFPEDVQNPNFEDRFEYKLNYVTSL